MPLCYSTAHVQFSVVPASTVKKVWDTSSEPMHVSMFFSVVAVTDLSSLPLPPCYVSTSNSRCTSRLQIKSHAHSVLLFYRVYIYCCWRLTVVSHGDTESWRPIPLLSPPFYILSYNQPLSKKLPVVTSTRWVWSVQDVLRVITGCPVVNSDHSQTLGFHS